MGQGIYLGAVRGIKIFVHWTFFLLIGWFVIVAFKADGNINHTLYALLYIGALFSCVILHELGHAFMARRFGIRTRDITLLPFGGMARMEKMPENPWHELLVAIAGPAVNIVIASGLLVFHWILGTPVFLDLQISRFDGQAILTQLMFVNVAMAFFNLIPAFPMDGGRIFRAILTWRFSRLEATRMAARAGQVFAVLFMVAGVFYSLSLVLIGIFIFAAARSESQEEEMRSSLVPYHLRDLEMSDAPTVSDQESLDFAVALSLKGQRKEFLVENKQGKVVGILTPAEMVAGLAARGQGACITDVMRKDFKILSPDLTLMEALRVLSETNMQMLPVGKGGKITGIIDLANILEFLEIRKAIISKATGG